MDIGAGRLGEDGDEGPTLTHRSFVGAVVSDLIGSMNHDMIDQRASYVLSNLMQVQRNVEDGRVPVGYSAVDCRRCLGAIDDKYLWSSVHLLWSGTNDESLSLSPSRLLPEEARQAMAGGLVSAFTDAMRTRRQAAQQHRRPALEALAWLLDIREVRASVLEGAQERGVIRRETVDTHSLCDKL